jgi:hypothetical protein
MRLIGSELGEVGQVIFFEMFAVRKLPGTHMPKSYFYERMIDYVDGSDDAKVERESPVRSPARNKFRSAVRKVLGKVRCVDG